MSRVLTNLDELNKLVNENGGSTAHVYQELLKSKEDITNLYNKLGGYLTQRELASMNVGDEIYLTESDTPTSFIIVSKNYLSTNNIIVMRKYLHKRLSGNGVRYYDINPMNSTSYKDSTIRSYVESTYKNYIANVTLAPINIPTYAANGSLYNLYTSVFLPSFSELSGNSFRQQISTESINRTVLEGSRFSYFSNPYTSPRALLGYDASIYALRSLATDSLNYIIDAYGNYNKTVVTSEYSIRPCLSLNPSSLVYTINRDASMTTTLAEATLIQ